MGKRASASGKKQVSANEEKSDDQILQERRETEGFDLADRFLGLTSWFLWALAGLWFAAYWTQAPSLSSVYPPACDGILNLLVAGQFCSGLSRSSPKGTWSSWRRAWQFCWVLALFSIGAGIAMVSVSVSPAPLTKGPSLLWAGGCCATAIVLIVTLPKGSSSPGKAATVPLARLLFLADAGLAIAVASSSLVLGSWLTEPLGLLTAATTVLPLSLWAAGLVLCSTEAEMVSAVSSVLLFYSGAAAQAIASLSVGGVIMALPSVALALAHLALFLPLPSDDPESNPFNRAFNKMCKNMSKMMSSQTEGFGDE